MESRPTEQGMNNLPKLTFVGGETRPLNFSVNLGGAAIGECDISFAVAPPDGAGPVFTKAMRAMSADEGGEVLMCLLEPEDTAELAGEYIYQITLRSPAGEVGIPGQGSMRIYRNIDRDFALRTSTTAHRQEKA